MATVYKLTQLFPATRGGVSAVVDASIRGIAKTNVSPHTIANEFVAAHIGRALGLPIPAGVVAEASGIQYYISLDVSSNGQTLPPIIPIDFAQQNPREAPGCVAFDILIANSDRHHQNVSADPAFSPARVSLFDHGHSLLGEGGMLPADRLAAVEDLLGCDGLVPPGNAQVFLGVLVRADELAAWIDRIELLPPFILKDACDEAAAMGLLTGADAAMLTEWLVRRRAKIRDLVRRNPVAFPLISSWGML